MTTISRALVTIKHNAVSISEETSALRMSGVTRDGVEVSSGTKSATYIENGSRSYQSIVDKIDAEFKLRASINAANAITMVKIGNKEYSIQDALTYRTHILPKIVDLRDRLVRDLNQARNKFAELERDYEIKSRKADNDQEYKRLIERREKPCIIDIQSKIDELNVNIKFFELEFDAILTEKNPVTVI